MAAKKKPKIRQDIQEAKQALKEIMQRNLMAIAEGMVRQIVSRASRLTESEMLQAIKGVDISGTAAYRDELLTALSVISQDALDKARKEVPSAKGVKLSGESESLKLAEFERLPAKLRRKVLASSQLIIDTQVADLEKAVYFQFQSSHDSTDSMDQLSHDLASAAEDYILGASIEAGSSAQAAQTVNSARNAFFLDDQVAEQLDAFEFYNGDPVSPICQSLAGTVFSADDPNLNRYWPPLHFNCKSTILPILKGNLGDREVSVLAPPKSAQESIQFAEGCGCGLHSAAGCVFLQLTEKSS